MERLEVSVLGRWKRCVWVWGVVSWQGGKGGKGGRVVRWQVGKGGRVVRQQGGKGGIY